MENTARIKMYGFPYYDNVIFLPLIYKRFGKKMNFEKILESYTVCTFDWLFEKYQIDISKNKSEDILKTVRESLYENKIINDFKYKDYNKIEEVRNKFKEYNNKYDRGIYSKLSSAYIDNNY